MSRCSICGAEPVKALGFCVKHYVRFQRYGDPNVRLRHRDSGTLEERFHAKYKAVEGSDCLEWQAGRDRRGYGQFCEGKKTHAAHRFSYELHNKTKIPEGLVVMHTCDNPGCVNPEHLQLGTTQDNIDDKVKKSRQTRGETHGNAILTEYLVRKIRSDTRRVKDIAKETGLTHQLVSDIRLRKRWKHVD